MAKAFSIEDGNLNIQPITSSKSRTYKDIDCTFNKKPSGDIYSKNDAAAVKQAIKNLLMTSRGEKPFNPYYGADLNSLLFSLSTESDTSTVEENIYNAISNYEPRAVVREVDVRLNADTHSANIRVIFRVVSTNEVVTTNVNIARVR